MIPSSKQHPCPVCGRIKDGDCRANDAGLVLCHSHQGQDATPGDPSPNGRYRFLKTSSDAQGFGIWKPAEQWDDRPGRGKQHRPARLTTTTNSAMATPHPLALPADASAITLALLPTPTEQPPEHWPDGQRLDYSPTQRVVVTVPDGGNKQHKPQHRLTPDGPWIPRAGEDPWPFWQQDDAITHGPGNWIFEAEGEKCAAWIRAAGFVAITHPGHNHSDQPNQARYKALQQAGLRGVVYLADNDTKGQEKAAKCLSAAKAAGLLLLVVDAAEVWPDLPTGGSIDDAPGTPVERVQQLRDALALQLESTTSDSGKPTEEQPFKQLIASTLQAVTDHDLDREMELRAELGYRFRLDHRQITAALFRRLVEQSAGDSVPADFSDQTLDLDQVEGMDELLPGFIPANDQALIYGKAGAGKTLACLAAAFALIDAAGFLDHDAKPKPGKVLFIASDSGSSPLKAALYDLGLADHASIPSGADQRFFVWAHDAKQGMPTWTASIKHWIQLLNFIQAKGIDLVLIDSAKAVCSQADPVVNYADNESVSAMLTFVKAVICRHAAVAWISHDGTEKGSHAGAKAWAEIPSVVHRIERQPDQQTPPARLWTVVKNRMGSERQFTYSLNPDGALEVCQGVEVVRDARQAILTVLTEALGRGHSSLSRKGLLDEIGQRFRYSEKTIDKNLQEMARAKHPDICRVKSPRGHYKLSPAYLQRLNRDSSQGKPKSQEPEPSFRGAHPKEGVEGKKLVVDRDLLITPHLPQGYSEEEKRLLPSTPGENQEELGNNSQGQASDLFLPPDRGIYREPEKSEAVSDSSQKLSHSLADQCQTEPAPDPAGDAAALADPSPAPADLLARHQQHLQARPITGRTAPLADDLAAFLSSTQPSPPTTDQDNIQQPIQQDTLAGSGDPADARLSHDSPEPDPLHLEELERLLSLNTWDVLAGLFLTPASAHPLDQVQSADTTPDSMPAAAPAIPADFNPTTWAAALPSYKQAALRLHLQHPSKPPAALINSVYAADPSMPSAFSGGALKTFLQSPEALAWIAAQAQQEAA